MEKIRFTNEVLGQHHGQTDCEAAIYVDGEIVGVAQYTLYGNELSMKYVFVRKEFRRMGLGSKLMRYVKSENEGHTYVPSMKTDDGYAFVPKENIDEMSSLT